MTSVAQQNSIDLDKYVSGPHNHATTFIGHIACTFLSETNDKFKQTTTTLSTTKSSYDRTRFLLFSGERVIKSLFVSRRYFQKKAAMLEGGITEDEFNSSIIFLDYENLSKEQIKMDAHEIVKIVGESLDSVELSDVINVNPLQIEISLNQDEQ